MADSNTKDYADISPVAVKCGRIAFWFYGGAILLIGGIAAFVAAADSALLASVLIVIGIVMIILGFILPPKLVAHLGFFIPW